MSMIAMWNAMSIVMTKRVFQNTILTKDYQLKDITSRVSGLSPSIQLKNCNLELWNQYFVDLVIFPGPILYVHPTDFFI